MLFKYQAIDEAGTNKEGEIDAPSRDMAISGLQRRGLVVISIREEGEIKSAGTVKIFRRETLIGGGKIKELQIQKIKIDAVKDGQEFGMMIESKIELAPGDILRATSLVEK